MLAMHTITAIQPRPASEPGALDGWEFLCSCGDRQSTSLGANEANRMASKHVEYWVNRAKKNRKVGV